MNRRLEKVKKGISVVYLHNGYNGFSYGLSINPIVLNYNEYKILKAYLNKKGEGKFLGDFENSNHFDAVFTPSIMELLNKRAMTIEGPEVVYYDSKEVELDCQKQKEILMKMEKSILVQSLNTLNLFMPQFLQQQPFPYKQMAASLPRLQC